MLQGRKRIAEREVTKLSSSGVGCSDYIFYSDGEEKYRDVITERRLGLHRIFGLPKGSDLMQHVGEMPNAQSGSDHLLMFAEFVIL